MNENKLINIFTDGGARGNPGPAAIGIVIKNEKGEILQKMSEYIGFTTNNVAEYQAVIKALTIVKDFGKSYKIKFFVDSQLVASQLSGLFKVKKTHLRELVGKIKILEQQIGGDVSYQSISREMNQEADYLVNEALDKRLGSL